MASHPRPRRFEIVPMRLADLDDIMEIERLSFRAPWSRQVFVEELDRDWAHVDVLKARGGRGPEELRSLGDGPHVAVRAQRESSPLGNVAQGPVIGFVNYWLVRDEVHILNIATHPDHRRRGHASRLLSHVVEFAAHKGCRYVTLEVRRSNHGAIRLYRKYGFRPVGIRPNYYVEDNEDAIVMLLDLLPKTG